MRVESKKLAVCVINEKDKIRLLFVPMGCSNKLNLIVNGPRGGFKGSVLVTLNELQRVIQALTAKMTEF